MFLYIEASGNLLWDLRARVPRGHCFFLFLFLFLFSLAAPFLVGGAWPSLPTDLSLYILKGEKNSLSKNLCSWNLGQLTHMRDSGGCVRGSCVCVRVCVCERERGESEEREREREATSV